MGLGKILTFWIPLLEFITGWQRPYKSQVRAAILNPCQTRTCAREKGGVARTDSRTGAHPTTLALCRCGLLTPRSYLQRVGLRKKI
ncbi:hypothetical protein EDB89DRAFT_121882 [Lactarius sanguifluus]|nr:hypothetical protein EDB89DRAFT_121882 [Lactarius sanguifluus]